MAATIKDIAKLTGLGYATISAYINGQNVRPKNKESIENAINELNYVRNEYARGLKLNKSKTIGILIPELHNEFSTRIISEAEDVLRAQGYSIIVSDCKSSEALEKKSIELLISKMVDGLIVMPTTAKPDNFSVAIARKIPVVVIDRLVNCKKISQIIINNREASFQAVKKLVDCGHRNIGLISGEQGIYTAYERCQGYKKALDGVNSFNENYIFCGDLTIEGGYLSMKKLINDFPEITAVFTTNYEVTIGSIMAINEMGKRVPYDYSFIGFDNTSLSSLIYPKLATVNQPLSQIGQKAAELILDLINKNVENSIYMLEAIIEEGGSIINL